MTLPEILESPSPAQSGSREDTSTQSPRYQLQANRAPRYKCGTCGPRNCSCVHQITIEPPDLRLARACGLALARTPEHPQHGVLAVQTQQQEPKTPPTIRHIIVTVEKTYASAESGLVTPLESTLKAMHDSSPSDCPTYRFKEWTNHERGGLEFTLAAVILPFPPSIIFGEVNKTCDNAQMIRCITAHQLWEKFQVISPPGDVYRPTQSWWLLVNSLDHSTLVSPITLLMCLENLRTLVESNDTLCFHLADSYRGNFSSQHWLQLIAITFCRQAKIHILDQLTYTPESHITALDALSIVHDWSCINMGDRHLRRTV